ncbi:MAG: DUF2029 domain-containing protein [Chloroflexi bacterium]|nr:DUF2029 domain-containing protein [Chloroflexota bacterium]
MKLPALLSRHSKRQVVGRVQATPGEVAPSDRASQHPLGRLVCSPSRPARLLRLAVVVVGVGLGLASLAQTLVYLQPPYVYIRDFLQEYLLARAIADGTDPYLPVQALAERYVSDLALASELPVAVFPHPTPHPPTVGILFLPAALLDHRLAAMLWFGLELALLAAVVYLLVRPAGAWLSLWGILALATALLGWHPVWMELLVGQLMLLILLVLAGARLALLSGRQVLGGVLLGFAMLVKPVTWPLLLLFALRRNWRVLGASVSTIVLGYVVALVAIGLGPIARYFTQVLPAVANTYQERPLNQSLWTFGWRLFEGTTWTKFLGGGTWPPPVESELAARVVSVAVPALALLIACLAVRRRGLDASLAIMACLSIVINPIAWEHYFVLAIIPAAQVVRWLLKHRLPRRETNLALLVAALLVVSPGDWARLGHLVASQTLQPGGPLVLRFALALLPVMPVLAIGALGWLVAIFDGTVPRFSPAPMRPGEVGVPSVGSGSVLAQTRIQ